MCVNTFRPRFWAPFSAGAYIPLAFQRGPALRFLYGIRRYPENLVLNLNDPPSLPQLTLLNKTLR